MDKETIKALTERQLGSDLRRDLWAVSSPASLPSLVGLPAAHFALLGA
jgi:hypothetical protein